LEKTKENVPKEAAHNMLEEPSRLLLDQLANHVAQNRADRIEPLIRRAYIIETVVVKQYLLNNEDGDGLAELRAGLHNPQTQRNDLGRQQEVDHLGRVVLDERTDNSQRGQAQVFEGAGLGCRVEEGVEEERDVRWSTKKV
jgi:hypothetical protein